MKQKFTEDELYTLLDALAHAIKNCKESGLPEIGQYQRAYEALDKKIRTFIK